LDDVVSAAYSLGASYIILEKRGLQGTEVYGTEKRSLCKYIDTRKLMKTFICAKHSIDVPHDDPDFALTQKVAAGVRDGADTVTVNDDAKEIVIAMIKRLVGSSLSDHGKSILKKAESLAANNRMSAMDPDDTDGHLAFAQSSSVVAAQIQTKDFWQEFLSESAGGHEDNKDNKDDVIIRKLAETIVFCVSNTVDANAVNLAADLNDFVNALGPKDTSPLAYDQCIQQLHALHERGRELSRSVNDRFSTVVWILKLRALHIMRLIHKVVTVVENVAVSDLWGPSPSDADDADGDAHAQRSNRFLSLAARLRECSNLAVACKTVLIRNDAACTSVEELQNMWGKFMVRSHQMTLPKCTVKSDKQWKEYENNQRKFGDKQTVKWLKEHIKNFGVILGDVQMAKPQFVVVWLTKHIEREKLEEAKLAEQWKSLSQRVLSIVSSPSEQPPLGQTPAFLTGAVAAADDVVVEEIQVAGKAYRRMFPDVESGGKVAFSGIDQHSVLLQHVLAMLTMRETQLLLQAESAGGAPLAFGALWKQHVGKPKKTNPPCFFQPTDHEAHPRTDATSMKLPFIGSRVCVGFQANGDDVVVDKGCAKVPFGSLTLSTGVKWHLWLQELPQYEASTQLAAAPLAWMVNKTKLQDFGDFSESMAAVNLEITYEWDLSCLEPSSLLPSVAAEWGITIADANLSRPYLGYVHKRAEEISQAKLQESKARKVAMGKKAEEPAEPARKKLKARGLKHMPSCTTDDGEEAEDELEANPGEFVTATRNLFAFEKDKLTVALVKKREDRFNHETKRETQKQKAQLLADLDNGVLHEGSQQWQDAMNLRRQEDEESAPSRYLNHILG